MRTFVCVGILLDRPCLPSQRAAKRAEQQHNAHAVRTLAPHAVVNEPVGKLPDDSELHRQVSGRRWCARWRRRREVGERYLLVHSPLVRLRARGAGVVRGEERVGGREWGKGGGRSAVAAGIEPCNAPSEQRSPPSPSCSASEEPLPRIRVCGARHARPRQALLSGRRSTPLPRPSHRPRCPRVLSSSCAPRSAETELASVRWLAVSVRSSARASVLTMGRTTARVPTLEWRQSGCRAAAMALRSVPCMAHPTALPSYLRRLPRPRCPVRQRVPQPSVR